MVIITKRIDLKKDREFNIFPLGDIHFGSLAFDEFLWNKFLKVFKEIKNPLVIVTGDIIDNDRPSTRDRRKTTFLDRIEAYKQEDEDIFETLWAKYFSRLEFLNKDNCLGMLDGDHYRVFSNGVTSTELLCGKLGVPYLGNGQALIKVVFYDGSKKRSINIHARHGIGYQSTTGGKLNANKKFADTWEGIDLFVKGHSHSAWYDSVPRDVFTVKGFVYKKMIYCINNCSFRKRFVLENEVKKAKEEAISTILKKKERLEPLGKEELKKIAGIIQDEADYPERKEYPPTSNRLIMLNLKFFNSKENGYWDLDYSTRIIDIDLESV